MRKYTKVVTVKLDLETYRLLEELRRTGLSRSQIIRSAIRAYALGLPTVKKVVLA
jgi:metal-responsive CopG/Arc/MetJ family transcriptional regulator